MQRGIVEGTLVQGADERIAYILDVSNWGNTPTSISFVLKDQADTDVTSSKCAGSPSAQSSTTILLPVIHSLVAGAEYRGECKFTIGGQVLECWFIIEAEE